MTDKRVETMNIESIRDDFNTAWQKNEQEILEIHHRFNLNPPLPLRLHHYTTIDGVYGIFRSQEMWSTSVEFLNDITEVSYGINLALDMIDAECQEWEGHAVVIDQLLRMRKHVELHTTNSAYYVTCFCEEPDLLSQWRAYGRNSGFSINFNAQRLDSSVRDRNSPPGLLKGSPERALYFERVIYHTETQRLLMKSVLKTCTCTGSP
jgi:hypothetical protein